MLVKLLSGKSFFVQIILGILFLILLFFQIQHVNLDWQSISGASLFTLACVVTVLFFHSTNLLKARGIAILYFLTWVLCFSEIALDFKTASALLTCTLIYWRFLAAEQSSENSKFLFDVGILLSISGFFYPPSFFLSGFLVILFSYTRSVNLKGFILLLMGFTLPLVVGVQLLYLIGQMEWLNSYQYAFCLDFISFPPWGLIPVGILVVLSWIDHLHQSMTQDINKRHKYFLTFLYFLNWILIIVLYAGENTNMLAFLGLPIAIFLTRFTQYQKSETLKEVIIWIYLATMIGYLFRAELVELYQDLLGNIAF